MFGFQNRATLIGNVGKAPESFQSQNGNTIVRFSLATTEFWKDSETGEKKQKTEWHQIAIFNEALGEIAMKTIKKGSKVMVEGNIRTREYDDKDGIKRSTTEIVLQGYKATLEVFDIRSSNSGNSRPDADTSNDSYDRLAEEAPY